MTQLIYLLTQTQTVVVFVSSIVFVFFIPLYQSLFGIIRKVNSELSFAIASIKQTSPTLEHKIFFENFEDVDNKINSIEGLKRICVNHHAKLTRESGKSTLKSCHPDSVQSSGIYAGVTLGVINGLYSRNQAAPFCERREHQLTSAQP